jgi:feruloyl esterase
MGAMWNQRAVTEAPVPVAKLTLVAASVMNKCDAVDGLKDGLIDDPRACRFDPARDVPACRAGADAPDCLTAAEAATVGKVYSGPVSRGKPLFPGFMLGSEAVTTGPNGSSSGWTNMIVPGKPEAKPADFNLAEGLMRYLILDPPQPAYDFMTFDYDRDPALMARWSKLGDAKDPDYYEAVMARNRNAADFARLFMMPGVAHCGGGIGPDRVDAVTAVIDWVEKNKAPDSLLATKVTNGQVARTRPLCPYPQVARYKGQGSIDDAANFSCAAPR